MVLFATTSAGGAAGGVSGAPAASTAFFTAFRMSSSVVSSASPKFLQIHCVFSFRQPVVLAHGRHSVDSRAVGQCYRRYSRYSSVFPHHDGRGQVAVFPVFQVFLRFWCPLYLSDDGVRAFSQLGDPSAGRCLDVQQGLVFIVHYQVDLAVPEGLQDHVYAGVIHQEGPFCGLHLSKREDLDLFRGSGEVDRARLKGYQSFHCLSHLFCAVCNSVITRHNAIFSANWSNSPPITENGLKIAQIDSCFLSRKIFRRGLSMFDRSGL